MSGQAEGLGGGWILRNEGELSSIVSIPLREVMFYGAPPPTFNEILWTVREFEQRLNAIDPKRK